MYMLPVKRHTVYGIVAAIVLIGIIIGLTIPSTSNFVGEGDYEASTTRSRALINAGEIVPSEEVRVAEYLQYYDQYFPEPTDEAVGLDLRLGNEELPAGGCTAWLQIGLQTRFAESEMVAPLNMAIVIDRSGSMDTSDKMPYLKQSLRIFVESLNPDDIISIITYSDDAQVLVPAQKVGNGYRIRRMIDGIEPGGATNLHAGLMLGFREVNRNYDIRRNNQVILLTDGVANRGVTDPDRILQDMDQYNHRGIHFSIIGLGLEYNDSLLSRIADEGKGGYMFIDSPKEMDRVFRQHAEELKQRVASDVTITIIPQSGVRLVSLTGAEGSMPSQGASVELWPMSTGESTVVMAELRVDAGRTGYRDLATVRLEYLDEFAQEMVILEDTITGNMKHRAKDYDAQWDLEILRNVTVQRMAEGIKEIDMLSDEGRFHEAWQLAGVLEQVLLEAAYLTGDDQMYENVALMQRYQETLAKAMWQTEYRDFVVDDDDWCDYRSSQRPYRGTYYSYPEIEIQ